MVTQFPLTELFLVRIQVAHQVSSSRRKMMYIFSVLLCMENKIKITCENCTNEFSRDKYSITRSLKNGNRIFCSKKCASEIRTKESILDVSCKECGKTFNRQRHAIGENVFCSKSCSNAHSNRKHTGPNARNFKHGKSMYRDLALSKYQKVCMICGCDKEYAIQVHHIDGDRSNGSIDNLAVLCANCHLGVHKEAIKLQPIE